MANLSNEREEMPLEDDTIAILQDDSNSVKDIERLDDIVLLQKDKSFDISLIVSKDVRKKISIHVGERSSLYLCVFILGQCSSDIEYHFTLDDSSSINIIYIDFSGGNSNISQKVELNGVDSKAKISALIIPSSGVEIRHEQQIVHVGDRSESLVNYLAFLLREKSFVSWNGLVNIERSSRDISTYESSKNYILDKSSKAVAIPNLQIDTNNVKKAAHATSTGELDEESIFYMNMRGIKREEAIKILMSSYAEEIFKNLKTGKLKEHVYKIFRNYIDNLPSSILSNK